MATFDRSDDFKRDYKMLTQAERDLITEAIKKFNANLDAAPIGFQPTFDAELRVKPMKYHPSIWEMTWEKANGRATFTFASPLSASPTLRHIKWRRIGSHAVFSSP